MICNRSVFGYIKSDSQSTSSQSRETESFDAVKCLIRVLEPRLLLPLVLFFCILSSGKQSEAPSVREDSLHCFSINSNTVLDSFNQLAGWSGWCSSRVADQAHSRVRRYHPRWGASQRPADWSNSPGMTVKRCITRLRLIFAHRRSNSSPCMGLKCLQEDRHLCVHKAGSFGGKCKCTHVNACFCACDRRRRLRTCFTC